MKYSLLLTLILLSSACSNRVVRHDERSEASRELSGKWNDTDSRLVAETMIPDITKHYWLNQFILEHNRKPVVQVGSTVTDTYGELIDTNIFELEVRNALVAHQNIRVRSSLGSSFHTRDTLRDQDLYANKESKKDMFNEIGSDFILTGSIHMHVDRHKRKQDKTYAIDMELRHSESQELVWSKRKLINKQVDRPFFN